MKKLLFVSLMLLTPATFANLASEQDPQNVMSNSSSSNSTYSEQGMHTPPDPVCVDCLLTKYGYSNDLSADSLYRPGAAFTGQPVEGDR
jgi:hypothetical protein